MVGLCVILWITAISTDHWMTVTAPPQGVFINESKRFFLHSNSGIFRYCRTAMSNSTSVPKAQEPGLNVTVSGKIAIFRYCKAHEMWPNETTIKKDAAIDKTILNYTRTEVSFSVISLFLMVLGCFFSIYTFRNPRYMFKRLAGGIHFLTCGSTFSVIEVLINSIEYERKHLPFTYPPGSTHSYGYSIVLAWLVFVQLLVAGFFFMLYSRKRKGVKAPTEEMAMADEPTIIGR